MSVLDQGKAVVFASFELSAGELVDRFISMLSGVPLRKLETGYIDDETTKAKERLHNDDLIVLTGRSFGVLELRARIRQLKQRLLRQDKDLGLVIVDLLTNLKAPAKERRDLEVGFISRELKVLAQELDVTVVAVSQLNRAVEYRENPRPRISDLRESGAIEQDADKILLIFRPEFYLAQKPAHELSDGEKEALERVRGKCELIVAAQRQGPSGVAWLLFDGACARFRPLARTVEHVQEELNTGIVDGSR